MNYILKQFDEPLVKFSATTDTSEPEIQILWTNEEKAAFLPLDLTLTPDGLSRWLRRRTIRRTPAPRAAAARASRQTRQPTPAPGRPWPSCPLSTLLRRKDSSPQLLSRQHFLPQDVACRATATRRGRRLTQREGFLA